jgi:DNA mismatch repair protein MutS
VDLSEAAAALAVLDVTAGLAHVAVSRNYVRPLVDTSDVIEIVDGRHPVVESMLSAGSFVANDCHLSVNAQQLMLITGPNMAGKSTYMRQVAHIVLLAQMGSYVPASACRIGVCDRLFTRVGASDNLARGDSTFMVEMRETSHILAKATRRSLIILDEVGRGTSTYDGVSLAWAITEFLHDAVGARTMFATHYHELVALAHSRSRIKNVSAAIRESNGQVVFLRRIVAGGASKSYGIDVARLAGLPRSVIARSRQLLAQLEGGAALGHHAQLSLLSASASAPALEITADPLIEELADVDIDATTPLAALQLLADFRKRARGQRPPNS